MKTVLPIDIVTLGDNNSYHLLVSGTINDKKYDLLIDTGASHTIFDATLIPELPVNEIEYSEIRSTGISVGELNARIGCIETFKLGDLQHTNWIVILIDLTHVNEMYNNLTDKVVAGLIGSDFLLKHKAVIDYKKRELILRDIRRKDNFAASLLRT